MFVQARFRSQLKLHISFEPEPSPPLKSHFFLSKPSSACKSHFLHSPSRAPILGLLTNQASPAKTFSQAGATLLRSDGLE